MVQAQPTHRAAAAPRARGPWFFAGLWIIFWLLLALTGLGWLVWTAVEHSRPEVTSQLVRYGVRKYKESMLYLGPVDVSRDDTAI